MSLLFEASGRSFRLPLLMLAVANAVGAVVMTVVPYQSKSEKEGELRLLEAAAGALRQDGEEEEVGLLADSD